MRRLILISTLLVAVFSLNGCLFWGGQQMKALGTLTHPEDEFKYAEDVPGWVKTGKWSNDALYGVGSAFNISRMNAIEDARTAALANLAEKMRTQINLEVSQVRSTEGTIGANTGHTKRIIEERVSETLRNARMSEVFVHREQVWAPGKKKLWRIRAYVLATTDVNLYDMLQPKEQ